MSDGGKGSTRRPENIEVVRANWDLIFTPRKRPEGFFAQAVGTEPVITLGEWKEGEFAPEPANQSDPL